jgi:SAM-dependent methyltransferase
LTKTNAATFAPPDSLKLPRHWMIKEAIRRLRRCFSPIDDFDWRYYHEHYRAEFEASEQWYTHNLNSTEFRLADGRLFLVGDSKPLHPNHRCVWEAVVNLPEVRSVAEIGCGAGYLLMGVGQIMGPEIRLSGYDISQEQLAMFSELWPESRNRVRIQILDISQSPIPGDDHPDVVFVHTVLMHIQRPEAYRDALTNLFKSAKRYAVIMDHWPRHDYVQDVLRATRDFGGMAYRYDSGSRVATVVAKTPRSLKAPYEPLGNDSSSLISRQSK